MFNNARKELPRLVSWILADCIISSKSVLFYNIYPADLRLSILTLQVALYIGGLYVCGKVGF